MNLQSQLIFGGLVFLLGLAAGLLIFWLTRDDEPKKPEPPHQPAVTPAARPPVGGAVKLGTLWRDETGRTLVQTPDGSLLEDEEAEKLLQQARSTAVRPDLPTLTDQPLPPPGPFLRQAHPDLTTAHSLEGISQPKMSRPVEPISTSPVENFSRVFQKPSPPVPRSLAMQINDILQERIAGSDLARRGLRLVDLPNQELGVELDLHTYPGIDSVPDTAATDAIRDAAREWQSQHRT